MMPFQEPGLGISDCPDALDTCTFFFMQAVSRACRAYNVLVTIETIETIEGRT